jgi:hypothetical protein
MIRARFGWTGIIALIAMVEFLAAANHASSAADRYGVAVIIGNKTYTSKRVPAVSYAHPRESLSDFPYEKPHRHSLPDPCRDSWKCGYE